MAKITVLGVGLVGKAIALDLAQQHKVVAVDHDKHSLNKLGQRDESIQLVQADLSIASNIKSSIQAADLVVSAVPGFMGYRTLETIIQCKKDVVDIAFFPEDALALDSLAKTQNVTAVVDMGVAPGLSNLVLGYQSQQMNVENFKCMVGGLPKNPQPPFHYKAPFSPVDVIEEYLRPARLVKDGKRVTLPALSDIEQVHFENIGMLEAFNTDGLRSLIESFPDIPNMVEKTLRYPGHADLIQSLKDIGYFDEHIKNESETEISPLKVSTHLLKKHWQLNDDEPEFTVMRINLSGCPKDSANNTIHLQYDLYDEYDPSTRIASMSRTTGYTCTAAVNLLLEKAFSRKGVITPEIIGQQPGCYQNILNYYQQRGIHLMQTQLTP